VGETETIRAQEPNSARESVTTESRSAVQRRFALTRRHALRFATMAMAVCATVVIAVWVITGVAGFRSPDIKNAIVAPSDVDAKPIAAPGATSDADAVTAAAASERISDRVHDADESSSFVETLNESLPESSQMLGLETKPVQVAAASAFDLVHSEAKEAVSSTATRDESSPDPAQALAPEAPPDTKETASSTQTLDTCPVREACVEQYLWSVYQRALKQDTIKLVERRKVTVKLNGKSRVVIKEFTKLVDEDFTWKDPKAAEKAGMSLMEYVIGGIDQGFKVRLYHALHAMDDAGLSPGITSAFRDDYRQSLASGLKAATDRSYHGGSSHGGYGHGLAVDLVSVKGETRAERLVSSENLWKWIDAHGQELGIGRPYLDRDPAHVAPIDGKEYAAHRRGTTRQHAQSENKKHNLIAVRNDHGIAKRAKTTRSSML
jgi:hypothetical protein